MKDEHEGPLPDDQLVQLISELVDDRLDEQGTIELRDLLAQSCRGFTP